MTVFENLDEKFDVEPTQKPAVTLVADEEPVSDTEKARQTLNSLIDKGTEAIDGILHVAKQTDHPRAYEVAGQLIKALSDVAKDLVNVKKTEMEMTKKTDSPKIGTQNNVFVGSTHELMKMLKQPIPEAEVEVVDE